MVAPLSASPPFPIVGIGASAGGIEALQAFFKALPERIEAVLVVILHLDPEFRSELASILASKTTIPVDQVSDTLPLEANRIYVIPPNRQLQLTDTAVSALPFTEPRGQRAPIDHFFRSLAKQYGDGFAIILSGSGSDGALGVKAIKEQGGIILVQDPKEARFEGMPRAAIATGVADAVLPVRELARQLADLLQSKYRIYERLTAPAPLKEEKTLLARIFAYLRRKTGHDFSQYKRPTVLRRLARRMSLHRQETLRDYFDFLRQNPEEAQALLEELLISVTRFFRDPNSWEALHEQIIPRLFEEKGPDAPLRVWVPGCATGEEAYSLAILLHEAAEQHGLWPEIQIFATDLDKGALATAREGRYPATIAADLSEARLRQFFQQEGDHYCVTREIRDCVLFASHSLLRDPPFSRLDLISCRNLLIYLDRELQAQIFAILRYALRPGGYLFLGASEDAEGEYFHTLDNIHRLFQARRSAHSPPPLPPLRFSAPKLGAPPSDPHTQAQPTPPAASAMHHQLLEALAPPSLLVDEQRQVRHLSETAGRFLQPPGGP